MLAREFPDIDQITNSDISSDAVRGCRGVGANLRRESGLGGRLRQLRDSGQG